VDQSQPWSLLFPLGKGVSLYLPLSTQQYLNWVWDAKTAKELLVAEVTALIAALLYAPWGVEVGSGVHRSVLVIIFCKAH